METINVKAQKRDLKAKVNILRRAGKIPAIFYGAKQKNIAIAVDQKIFTKIFNKVGENTVLDLDVEGEKAPLKVLAYAVDLDPVSDEILHIDFLNVDMQKKITTHVPLNYVGIAPAVKDLGGIFMANRNEISISCLPADIPRSIEIDISGLKEFQNSIHLESLKLPNGVETLDGKETLLCSIITPKGQDEEEEKTVEESTETVPESAKEEEKVAGAVDKEKKGNKDKKDKK